MGKVVSLNNLHCNLHRLDELAAIGSLINEAEELYGSIRPWTLPWTRRRINAQVAAILEEAIARRKQYFLSLGKEVPPLVLQTSN